MVGLMRMSKSISKTDKEKFDLLVSNYEIALNHFNYAESSFIDKAIEELNIALENLNNFCKELKLPLYNV